MVKLSMVVQTVLLAVSTPTALLNMLKSLVVEILLLQTVLLVQETAGMFVPALPLVMEHIAEELSLMVVPELSSKMEDIVIQRMIAKDAKQPNTAGPDVARGIIAEMPPNVSPNFQYN